MKNTGQQRDKIGLLVRKCKDADYKFKTLDQYKHLFKLPVISIDDEIIKCSDLMELSKIYNSLTLFISFDPHTYHSTMAALCGCQSVVIPSKYLSSEEFYNVQKYGVGYGLENIDFAKLTYSKMIDDLKVMEQNTFTQCANFVELVQNHFIYKSN